MFSRAGKCIGVLGWGLGPRGGGRGNRHFSMPPLGCALPSGRWPGAFSGNRCALALSLPGGSCGGRGAGLPLDFFGAGGAAACHPAQ